jgi:hypothetical protein
LPSSRRRSAHRLVGSIREAVIRSGQWTSPGLPIKLPTAPEPVRQVGVEELCNFTDPAAVDPENMAIRVVVRRPRCRLRLTSKLNHDEIALSDDVVDRCCDPVLQTTEQRPEQLRGDILFAAEGPRKRCCGFRLRQRSQEHLTGTRHPCGARLSVESPSASRRKLLNRLSEEVFRYGSVSAP